MALPNKLYCPLHEKMEDIKDFYMNYNEYNVKYNYQRMYFCKEACRDISNDMRKKQENFQLFVISMCNYFNMPYMSEAMFLLREREDVSKNAKSGFNYVWQYQDCLRELKCPMEYWNNLYANNSFLHIDLLKVACPTTDGDMDMFASLEKYWGKKIDSLEDYLSLQEAFDEYTQGEEMTPYIEKLFRRLCLDELEEKKIRASKADQQELKKINDRIDKTSEKLGIDKFVSSKFKSVQEKMIEDWAYITENTEPLDWEDENLKDRLGFEKDYDDIVRSMANKIVGSKEYPTITLDDIEKSTKRRSK